MNEQILKKIKDLRSLIGYLAEKKVWWETNFFDTSSLNFLSYSFPKLTRERNDFYLYSTKYLIDNEVGSNYYHLFRLPLQIEEKLHKTQYIGNEVSFTNIDEALKILRGISEDLLIEPNEGPINVGSSELIDKDTIQTIAAHYLSAFEKDYKVHPYLN